jgi:hypothetical protein
VVDTLVVHKPWRAFDFLTRAFILGILTYFALQLFLLAAGYVASVCSREVFVPRYLTIWDSLTNQRSPIQFNEIVYSSLTSLVVAFLAAKIINDKLLIKLGHQTRVTKKFGDDSVWSYFLNSDTIEWVWIRYPGDNLVYAGWVQSFSDTEKVREIVLEDVKVYRNSDSEFLYELPAAYLAAEPSRMIIELAPVVEGTETVASKERSQEPLDKGGHPYAKKTNNRRLR